MHAQHPGPRRQSCQWSEARGTPLPQDVLSHPETQTHLGTLTGKLWGGSGERAFCFPQTPEVAAGFIRFSDFGSPHMAKINL